MLVSYIVDRMLSDPRDEEHLLRELKDIAKGNEIVGTKEKKLCEIFDKYTKLLIKILPKATINENINNAPNLTR